MNKTGRISDLLVRAGLINSSGLERALEVQSKTAGSLVKVLVDMGLVDESAASIAIAQELRLEYVGADIPEVLPETKALLPLEFCRIRLVAPLGLRSNLLRLAMVDSLDYSTIQDVMFRTSKEVVAVVASESAILTMLGQFQSDATEGQNIYEMLTSLTPEGE